MRSSSDVALRGVAGWVSLGAVVAATVVTVVSVLRTVAAHEYGLWPLTPNGLDAAVRAAARGGAIGAGVLLVVALPARLAAGGGLGVGSVARLWTLLGVGGAWALWGLRFNRIDVGHLWRESVSVGPLTLPRALTDGATLATNVGVTLAAAVIAVVVFRLLRFGLGRVCLPELPAAVVRAAVVVTLLVVALGFVSNTLGRPLPGFGGDVILISLDATRADRLGSYGGPPGLTPHLDRLAADAERFERAYCQEPWTLTSHMSMFTGLHPDAHGLDFGRALAADLHTLPERLRDAGMATYGSVFDCFLLGRRFGYGDGFDRYEVTGQKALDRARTVAGWLERSDRPTFLFLHFYDPHSDTGTLPYESSEPFRSRFAPGAESGFDRWTGPGGASETLREVNEEGRPIPDSLRENLRRLYDAGVAETDAAVGHFLDRLRAAGRYDDAMIVVVADHGEALGEADHFMHERLMEETLRVPLLIKWPKGVRASTVRTDLTETVDLLPTVLAATGLLPADVVQGVDLAAGPTARAMAFHRSGPEHAITTDDGWRLVYRWDEAAGVQPIALRRAGAGPGDGPDHPDELAAFLDRWVESIVTMHRANAVLASRYGGGEVTMGEADEELLRSLGYIE